MLIFSKLLKSSRWTCS